MLRRRKMRAEPVSGGGFYSIVRYVEDVERREPLNVGIVLEANGETLMDFVDREELNGRLDLVHRFHELVDRILQEGRVEDAEEDAPARSPLHALARRRFPHFEISEPRQIVVDGSPHELLQDLRHRLVESPRARAAAGTLAR